MPHATKVPASFWSRKSPFRVRRTALVTQTIVMTEEFVISMASLEGSL